MAHSLSVLGPAHRLGARVAVIAAAGLSLIGCAEGPDDPGGQPTPTPSVATHPVEAYVFYDEDGDLTLDVGELARVPGVDVRLGTATGRTDVRTGHARLEAVPAGQQTAETDHLPPYFTQKVAPKATVPTSDPLLVPVTLDIGSNRPNVYMAFGDSITEGTGSSDGFGYQRRLQSRLGSYFNAGTVENEGVAATRTGRGLERIGEALAAHRPAYTLILYGTNDWNDNACKREENCPTLANLTGIVRAVRTGGSLPVLATIIPASPAYPTQNPAARHAWVTKTNESLRLMAQTEGVLVADLHATFMASSNLAGLFSDHVHPNDSGYELIAAELLRAIAGNMQGAALPLVDPARPIEMLVPPQMTPLGEVLTGGQQ